MSTHIHESSQGACFQVSYERGQEGLTTFTGVHVLDQNYKPVGPDLLDFLDDLFYFKGLVNGTPEGEKILSIIAGEITSP